MRIRNLIMTGLIASGGFALTSCKKFIPVEYYGIPNPKLQNKQK